MVAPVTILAASICILSIAFASYCAQVSHTILAYSRVGRTNEILILFRESLSGIIFSLRMTYIFCHALEVIKLICSCQVPSFDKITPKCLM